MNKLTYSLKLVLRPDKVKADSTIPVYYSVRVGPTTTRLPTGKSVELANWNVKECCPKKTTKHGQLLAAYFNGKVSDWHTYMLQLETMGSPITLTIATGFFKGNTKVTLFSFWEEQLELWQNEKEAMLKKTRDYFVFSSMTGLRYSDVMNLRFFNIKTEPEAITLEMTKTKKQVMIPLVASAKAIIEKYNKLTIRTPLTKVFPYVDNQVLNRNLKELMKLSGINKNLTFHVSRHTFASCHVQLGTNLIHLKDLMGHAKITETQMYAKSQTEDLFGTMNKMGNIYGLEEAV